MIPPGHNHVIVVAWFVPSSYSDSASSAHIHGFYEVRMPQYVHPLHQNVLKHFIYIYKMEVKVTLTWFLAITMS